MGIDFDNVNDAIDLGLDLPFLNGASAGALMAWVRTTRTSGLDQRIVGVSIGPPPGTSNSTRLGIGISGTSIFAIGRDLDGVSPTTVTSGAVVTANVWAHVGVSYLCSTRLASLYFNGALVATGTFTNSSGVNFSATNCKNGAIGASVDGITGTFFDGDIEDARCYNRVVTAGEFLSAFTARGHDNSIFGLQAKFGMNENATGTIVPASGVKNLGPVGASSASPISAPVYSGSVLAPRRRAA